MLKETPHPRLGIVDDDEDFLLSLGIDASGILTTSDPEVSMEWVRQGLIDMLIADLRMPGESGIDILQRAHAIDSGLALALWTGNKLDHHEADALATLHAESISKNKHRLRDVLDYAANLVDLVPKHQLIRSERRVAELEELNRAWVADMIEQLRQIPNPERATISSGTQSFTVAELIDDIQNFRRRGIEYVTLWRKAMNRVRKERQ